MDELPKIAGGELDSVIKWCLLSVTTALVAAIGFLSKGLYSGGMWLGGKLERLIDGHLNFLSVTTEQQMKQTKEQQAQTALLIDIQGSLESSHTLLVETNESAKKSRCDAGELVEGMERRLRHQIKKDRADEGDS